jgi:hypothetical protein
MTSDSPFFVVGAQRSGTTLLRLMLMHHPAICSCLELEFVAPAIAGRPDFPDGEAYRRFLAPRFDYRSSGLAAEPGLDFVETARGFLRQLQAAEGKPVVGATVHHHFDELPRVWPHARYVHLVRDPRDVARSCVEMGWGGNAWAGAQIWLDARTAWRRLCQEVPPDRRIEVRYEDLVARPEAELARITAFLGLPYDPAMLEIEKDTTYSRPNARLAKDWRTQAPEKDVRQVEAQVGPALAEAGYAPSGLPPLQVGPLRRLALRTDARLGRMRFAQRRHGFGLWLAGVVARRLPVPAWQARTQRRVDEINLRYLK